MKTLAALLSLFAACGDNVELTLDSAETPRCAPTPGPLPTTGQFLDPLAFELAGCVEGALDDLPGRWFVRDPETIFNFEYPKYEGDCTAGFRQSFTEDDTDETDGVSRFTWTDGTRLFTRRSFQFQFDEEQSFEFTDATVICRRADDTLAGVNAVFDSDRGERLGDVIGSRFGLADSPAENLALVGEVATFSDDPLDRIVGFNVVIDANLAYVVGPSGMTIVDVTAPAAPVVVSHVPADNANRGFNDVRVVRTATDPAKVVAFASPIDFTDTYVIDVTDPAKPTMLASLPEYSHSVHVVDGVTKQLYLATYTEFVPKYDITNPLVPVRLGAAEIAGEPTGVHDLYVDGDRIYANYTDSGLVALDVSAGLDAAVELGRLPTSYSHASWVGTTSSNRKIILHGDEGMTGTDDGGAFLRILDGDSTSKTYMTEIGRYQTRKEVGMHNIQMVGDKVYLSYYQDGVRIVDVADPTQPTEVAHFNTWDPETSFGSAFEGAVGVRVAQDHVFVADIARGLLILKEP